MIEMQDSIETDDFSLVTMNQVPNEVIYSTKCFIETSLSSIYIPSYLLSSVQSDSNSTEFDRSVFHTLQKDDAFQSIAGFSTYIDLPEDEEIFESDSDNEFLNSDASVEDDDLLKNKTEDRSLSCHDLLSHLNNESENLPKITVPAVDKIKNLEELLSMVNGEAQQSVDFECLKNLEIGESNTFEPLRKTESKNLISIDEECRTENNEISLTDGNIVSHNSQASLFKPVIQNSMDFDKFENLEKKNVFGTFKVDKPQLNESLYDNNSSQQQPDILGISKFCNSIPYDPDLDLRDFAFNYKKKDSKELEVEAEKIKEKKHREKRQKKFKKKLAKYIEIDDSGSLKDGQIFLNESLSDARMHDFIQSIVKSKQNGYSDVLPIHCASEFPTLEDEKSEIKFIKSEKSPVELPKVDMKSVAEVFSKRIEESMSEEIEEEIPIAVAESPTKYKKIAIDNIPKNAPEEDVKSMISSFGDIKSFKSYTDKDFQRVIIEVDSSCDIDWVIECLNDSDAFGAFSETLLKCYCL